MAKRIILTSATESENAGIEQNMCVVNICPEEAKSMLGYIELVDQIKKKNSNLYAMEYWCGYQEFVVDRKLYDVVERLGEDKEDAFVKEVNRIADLVINSPYDGLVLIEDPEGLIEEALAYYEDEADDDTSLDCYTVVVNDDSIQYTALAKDGSGEGIKSHRIHVNVLRWLAGEDVKLEEKVEAPAR
jgi:hypothetical protein